MRHVTLNGKPSFVDYFDDEVIVWSLPSGCMIQTPNQRLFMEGCRFPCVPQACLQGESNKAYWEWIHPMLAWVDEACLQGESNKAYWEWIHPMLAWVDE